MQPFFHVSVPNNAKDVELESLERVDYFGTSEYF